MHVLAYDASILQLHLVCWVQAESVNELVGARTAAAADSAIAGLTGGIGAVVQKLRRSALLLLAELEVCWPHCCLPFTPSGVFAFCCNVVDPWPALHLAFHSLSVPFPYMFHQLLLSSKPCFHQ